jgi:hypothetical protein
VGEQRDPKTWLRWLLVFAAVCVISAAIAPAAGASSLTGNAQAQINSAEQLAQQMTANAQQTAASGVTAAENAASNAEAGARQTIATALDQTATLTSTTAGQANSGSASGSSSSSGTSSPVGTQDGTTEGTASSQTPSGSTPSAAVQGLAAGVADQVGVPASIPPPASTHALKALTGPAPQRATRSGATRPRRPLSGRRSRTGPPPKWPRDRAVSRPVPAEHPGAAIALRSDGSGPIPEAPTSGRPAVHTTGMSGRARGHRGGRPTRAPDDSTAGSLAADEPISVAPPAGGSAGAAGGGSGAAPAVALLAAFALSLLIGPSGRRMSLELSPWRSALLALPPERPG